MKKRNVYIVVALGCLLLAGWGFVQFRTQQTKGRYNTTIQEAARWDLPTSIEDLATRNSAPEGESNGFEFLLAAQQRIDWSKANEPLLADAINHLKRPLPGKNLPPGVRHEAQAFLDAHREAIGEIRAAVRMPVFRAPLPLVDGGHALADALRRHRFALSNTRRVFTLSTDLAIEDGDTEGALRDLETLFLLSTHLMRQPMYIFYSEGINSDYWCLAALVRLLEHTHPSEEQWKRLDALLTERIENIGILHAYWGDYIVNDADKKRTGRRWGTSMLEKLSETSDWDEMLENTHYEFHELSDRRERDRLAELMTTLQWTGSLRSSTPEAIQYLEAHRDSSGFIPYGLGPIFFMPSEYAWGGPVTIREHHKVRLITYRLLAAIARYAQAHNAWPNSFDELVPEFIEAVPIDPFTHEPYRYLQDTEQVITSGIRTESLQIRSAMRKPLLQ